MSLGAITETQGELVSGCATGTMTSPFHLVGEMRYVI